MDYKDKDDFYPVPKPKTGMDRSINIFGIILGIVMLIMVVNALLNQ